MQMSKLYMYSMNGGRYYINFSLKVCLIFNISKYLCFVLQPNEVICRYIIIALFLILIHI